MHTALPWLLFAIGVFYAAGGIVLIRRMAMDTLLDKAIAAITLKPDPIEEAATRILTVGAGLTLASGLTLMAQSRAALPVFILNILVQAGYLIWAGRAQPPQNDLERRGRQATINALLIYIGVFGLVILMEQQGLWRAWFGTGLSGLMTELVVTALLTVAFTWLIWNPPGARNSGGDAASRTYPHFLQAEDDPPEYDPTRLPEQLRLSPEYTCWPTWDDATFSNVDPAILGFSDSLLKRIQDWDDLFQKGYNSEDPFSSCFSSIEEERLWADEAEAVWAGICEEWRGVAVNKISHLPYLTSVALEGTGPYEAPSEDRLQTMANQCGVFEIRDILSRLDILATERAAIPDWDGDTQDDISRAQKFHALVLARTGEKYRADVEAGLESEAEETRHWVRLALDGALS